MSKRKSNFDATPKRYDTLGLKQVMKHPTRITRHASTLADHVIADCE